MGTEAYEFDNGHSNFISSLCDIELFVLAVLASDEPAFAKDVNRLGRPCLKGLGLDKYFGSVVKFSGYYESGYKFSEHVQLFFDDWVTLDLRLEGFKDPYNDSSKPNKKQYEVFNDLIDLIRTEGRSAEFCKRLSRRKEKSTKRFNSAISYINRLFDNCSRMEVLRVDFSYGKEFANNVSADQAMKHLLQFKNNWRSKPTLFEHLKGHIWKLEWGSGKGLHFHLILFIDSAHVHKDVYLAEQIGRYWVNTITEGRGSYWNCNASKSNYRKLGIGRISAADDELRKNLLNEVVGYLVKSEQYLRAIALGKGKLFGHGEVKVKSSAGKPRKALQDD